MSINWTMGTQNTACPFHGILFSNKKEQSTDMFYRNEPQQRYAK